MKSYTKLSRFINFVIAAVFVFGSQVPAAAAGKSKTTLKIGATPVPHAEILEVVKTELAKEGIDLEVIEYTDYVQPNLALDSGDLDANFFQHIPYLTDFNNENGTKLISAVDVHFEPLGLYPGKTKALADLKNGASIAIPNDTTNEARALLLLESIGLIELPPGSDLTVTPRDITSNPKKLVFKELEAAQIPNFLPDVDLGVINGNYALGVGLGASDTLAKEDAGSTAALTYANVVAVRDGDKYRPEIQALIKAVNSKAVADYIDKEYEGAVIPVFGGKTPTLDAIRKRGKIIIGVFGDKPPFGYIDEKGNNVGYDVYFGRRIALELFGTDDAVEFVTLEAANRIEFLKSNKVDIILANFTVTEERREQVDFALPYMQVALGVVVPEDSKLTSVDDLNGKKVIVNKGTTAEIFFTENYPKVELIKYDQNTEAFQALIDGRGDALAHDNTLLFAWAYETPGFKIIEGNLGSQDTIAAAVKKGNTDLLQWLNKQILALGAENFFHAAFDAELKDKFSPDTNPDDVVIEGGQLR